MALPVIQPLLRSVRGLGQDFRVAIRLLGKNPLTTILAIVTLGVGIGATTAVFSVLNALAFRNLPVRNPEQLVELSITLRPVNTAGFSVPMFHALDQSQHVFSNVIGFAGGGRTVEIGDDPMQANVLAVTGDFYSELGIRPAAGRLIAPEDMQRSSFTAVAVAVLGFGFWQRHYGGDDRAIGTTIRIDGRPFTIVGVAPRGFTAFSVIVEPDLTIPIAANAPPGAATTPGFLWIHLVGRLKPGIPVEQARLHLEPVWTAIKRNLVPAAYPAQRRASFLSLGLNITPCATGIAWLDARPRLTQPLWFMMALAVIVLGIACLNVAGLMLVRTAANTHTLGIRLALGASSWEIRRHVMAEALALASLGGMLGLLLAAWTGPLVVRFMLQQYPASISPKLTTDAPVLAVVAVIVTAVCVISGMVPLWQLNRGSSLDLLQGGSRIAARMGRLGPLLVAGQVALSVVAAIDAGLLVRTLQHLSAADPGFTRSNVSIAEILPRPGVPVNAASLSTNTYHRQLLTEVLPAIGLRDAALSGGVPLNGTDWMRTVAAVGASDDPVDVAYDSVTPGFLAVLGITVHEGRDFLWSDDSSRPNVAVVSRSVALRLFPGRSAVGQAINVGPPFPGQRLEIVGIINDVALYNVKHGSRLTLLVSSLQDSVSQAAAIVLRGQTSVPSLSHVVSSLGRDYVWRLRPLEEIARSTNTQDRLAAIVGSVFGGISVALAALGLYGLLMYVVSRRMREFAIRVALGGNAWSVMRLVLMHGLRIVAVGAGTGCVLAIANVRWLQALLYGLRPRDAVWLSGVPLLLATLATIVCITPAVRAANSDPLILLREE